VVLPRVEKVKSFPKAQTTTGFCELLKGKGGTNIFLDWKGKRKPERIMRIIELFIDERIETEVDLRRWLEKEEHIDLLSRIKGIGDKTIDYFRILAGIPTVAVDRHLIKFIQNTGIEINPNSYQEAKLIINRTAEELGYNRSLFDHSIWKYMSSKKVKM
jgi:thermostable 8-oxoguanine DNA glycosylase